MVQTFKISLMKRPDIKDLEEIGFSEIRLYTRIYKIWGFKQEVKGTVSKPSIKRDKDFLTASFIKYAKRSKMNIKRDKKEQFFLKSSLDIYNKELNFQILK